MQDCVILAGIGCGTPDTMTAEVRDAIGDAEIWIGARRILSGLPDGQAEKFAATKPGEILTALLENRGRRCCVLYSGDSGFYSGARSLVPLLEEQGIAYRILPGISSVQAAELEACIGARCGMRCRRGGQYRRARPVSHRRDARPGLPLRPACAGGAWLPPGRCGRESLL